MKRVFILSFIALSFISACKTTSSTHLSNTTDTAAVTAKKAGVTINPSSTININAIIPYSENSRIASNIKAECTINKQLSDYIATYSALNNINVVQKASINKNDKGKTLMVEISDAVSRGNAFIGHRKSTDIRGTLYNNGIKEASFTATRESGGGFMGGFKGSCSVLGRTVKALGKDVSLWLKAPIDGRHLGN